MKALQIQTPTRFSAAATLRRMAQVINPSQAACLTTAIAATIVFFACLGAMYVPGIVISGLTALMAVALMPSVKEGGEL